MKTPSHLVPVPVSVRAGVGARRHRRQRAQEQRARKVARVVVPVRAGSSPVAAPLPRGTWRICIWNEAQRVPATLYGRAQCPDGFVIEVNRDPSITTDTVRRIVRYAFR